MQKGDNTKRHQPSFSWKLLRPKFILVLQGFLVFNMLECFSSNPTNVEALSTSNRGLKTFSTGNNHVKTSIFRNYNHVTDYQQLLSICENVYGGTDYLPKRAEEFQSNPSGKFKVMQEPEDGQITCLGNTRQLWQGYWFLEAIRTREEDRGRGLATQMTKHLIDTARECGADVMLSVTTNANIAMQRVFERVGMTAIGAFPCISFARLREIQEEDDNEGGAQRSMIEALGLANFFSEIDYKEAESNFLRVTSTQEIKEIIWELGALKSAAAPQISYLPLLYGVIPPEMVSEFEGGMDVYFSSNPKAMVLFFRDPSITSIRSNLVCSIISKDEAAFKHALAFASLRYARFALVLDPSVPEDSSLYSHIPFADSMCLVVEEDLL